MSNPNRPNPKRVIDGESSYAAAIILSNPGGKRSTIQRFSSIFLCYFTTYREFPKRLIDLNLRIDLAGVRRVTASTPQLTANFVDQLTLHNRISYDDVFLIEKFDMSQYFPTTGSNFSAGE